MNKIFNIKTLVAFVGGVAVALIGAIATGKLEDKSVGDLKVVETENGDVKVIEF